MKYGDVMVSTVLVFLECEKLVLKKINAKNDTLIEDSFVNASMQSATDFAYAA